MCAAYMDHAWRDIKLVYHFLRSALEWISLFAGPAAKGWRDEGWHMFSWCSPPPRTVCRYMERTWREEILPEWNGNIHYLNNERHIILHMSL